MISLTRLRKATGSSFNRNFLVLLSGSVLAQLIPLLASVVLARLYSPEVFGSLAVYNAIVMIMTTVVNLRYEFAIGLPEADDDAMSLSFLSFLIAGCFSIVLLLVLLFFRDGVLRLTGGESLHNAVYWIPLAVLLAGVYNVLNYFSLRHKQYKFMAGSSVTKSAAKSLFQVIFGLLGWQRQGLISGDMLGNVAGNTRMARLMLSYKSSIRAVTWESIKRNAVRYRAFPLVSLWGVFLNSFSISCNNFFIPHLFGITQLGYYSYGYRYLNLPLSLISMNMGQLFFQICADRHKEGKDAVAEFTSTFLKLLLLGLPAFILLHFFIEQLFVLAFGEQWRLAGTYAKILLPVFLVRTVFIPLSMITLAFEKQRLIVMIHAAIFLVNVAVFVISRRLHLQMTEFLNWYVVGMVLAYSGSMYLLYLIAGKKI